MPCWVIFLHRAGKNCPLNFRQGLRRLSYVGNYTLLSWEEGIGVTEVAYFASAFRSKCVYPNTWLFTSAMYFPVSSSHLIPDMSKNCIAGEHLQFWYFPFESWLLCIKWDTFFLCNCVMGVPMSTCLFIKRILFRQKEGNCCIGWSSERDKNTSLYSHFRKHEILFSLLIIIWYELRHLQNVCLPKQF